mgnify:CR=1 FL=1
MNFNFVSAGEAFERFREEYWDAALQVFVVLIIAGLASWIARRFLRRLHTHFAAKTDNPWDDALVLALPGPVVLAIWAIGLRIASLTVGGDLFTSSRAGHTFSVVLVICAVWFLSKWISGIEEGLVAMQSARPPDQQVDKTTINAVGKLLRLVVLFTGLLVCLQTWQIDISAVLAFGGVGGIAIGFAARDILANFFGGLTIYLDQPFKVGDWIRSPDREIEGTVEYIGWRHSRIRTFDKRPLYVPNSIFTTIVIENPQRMLNRRIYETIGIRYDDIAKMDAITKEVEEMLRAHPEIDTNQMLMVYFNAFAASSCDFFVYTFTKTTQWAYYHKVKHDVLLKISGIIAKNGAQIAFPTSTLHIASAPEPGAGKN